MFSRRQPKTAWTAITMILLTVCGTLPFAAQQSIGATLAERFSSLTKVFQGDDSSPRQSSAKSTGVSRNSSNRFGRSTYGSRSRTSFTSQPRSKKKSLIPEGLFSRKKSTPGGNGSRQPQQRTVVDNNNQKPSPTGDEHRSGPPAIEPRTADQARAGSVTRKSALSREARKSPPTTRENELDEALQDLLAGEDIMPGSVIIESEETLSNEPELIVSASEPAGVESEPAIVELIEEIATSQADPTDETEILPQQAQEAPAVVAVEQPAEPVAVAEPAEELAPVEVPFGQAPIDLHDALLSEELYEAMIEPDLSSLETSTEELIEQDTPLADRPGELSHRGESLTADVLDEIIEQPTESEDTLEVGASESFVEQSVPTEEFVEVTEPVEDTAEVDEPFEVVSTPVAAQQSEETLFSADRSVDSTAGQVRSRPAAGRRTVVRNDRSRRSNQVSQTVKRQGDVLTTIEQPVIVSHVEGPRSILIGREASYRVVLENTGRTQAQNLSAVVNLPEWADLVDVVCSSGLVEQQPEVGSQRSLQWHLPELGAHASQTLQLQLIPRSGREFQLGVQWSQESATAPTTVQVQEPMLEMSIHGPQEVMYGVPHRYQLILKNPGTGPAEGVSVRLIPPGSDSASASTHTIGTLGPQEVKEFELELTAREAGDMILQANAYGAGDLEAEVIKRVLCRKPQLEVDWRGPDQKYAGTETAYYFRVSNTGNATTEPIEVKVRLPMGISFLTASDSYSFDSVSGVITWRVGSLIPGEEQFMQFGCELDRPGVKEFEVVASTVDRLLRDSKSVRTEVIALADLKLEVNDPRGAHPTGEPVTYEIRVENRGTTDARGITIVGLFSEGIDPVAVEGAQSSVRDGRVTFQPVKSLPPGGEILLRIRAVASEVGTHIFRAEVACHDLDIKLAAEETTRFFEDEFNWYDSETPYTAEKQEETITR